MNALTIEQKANLCSNLTNLSPKTTRGGEIGYQKRLNTPYSFSIIPARGGFKYVQHVRRTPAEQEPLTTKRGPWKANLKSRTAQRDIFWPVKFFCGMLRHLKVYLMVYKILWLGAL